MSNDAAFRPMITTNNRTCSPALSYHTGSSQPGDMFGFLRHCQPTSTCSKNPTCYSHRLAETTDLPRNTIPHTEENLDCTHFRCTKATGSSRLHTEELIEMLDEPMMEGSDGDLDLDVHAGSDDERYMGK